VDEAGRGCLAGPLVAAGVILDYRRAPFRDLKGLTDSKLLTPKARETMYQGCCAPRRDIRGRSVAGHDRRIGTAPLQPQVRLPLPRALMGEYDLAVVDGFDLKRPDLRALPVVGRGFQERCCRRGFGRGEGGQGTGS